jgi:hypothetical protein
MSVQPPNPLAIPEILCEVLNHLRYDSGALFTCCQVNKAWAENSLNILWRSQYRDGMRRLVLLPECRRQFYADKIRSLNEDTCPTEYWYCIETLNFPRLRKLKVFITDRNWESNHHLVPTLEVFQFYGFKERAEDYLRQLPERCPNLRELRVRRLCDRYDFDRVEDYLRRFSKLQSVNMTGMSHTTMTDEVFFYLARLPLDTFRMDKLVTSEIIDLAYRRLGTDRLFPNVAQVGLRMEWRSATTLLPTLTTLRELELQLVSADTNHNALQAIGTLTNLTVLHLTTAWESGKSLSREELLAIAKLHRLRNLRINGYETLVLDKSVTDDDLASFLSGFPKAESIEINAFQASLIPSSATIALATTSTRLRNYEFRASWDLGFVESDPPPIFPRLENMYYKRLHCSDIPVEG